MEVNSRRRELVPVERLRQVARSRECFEDPLDAANDLCLCLVTTDKVVYPGRGLADANPYQHPCTSLAGTL